MTLAAKRISYVAFFQKFAYVLFSNAYTDDVLSGTLDEKTRKLFTSV